LTKSFQTNCRARITLITQLACGQRERRIKDIKSDSRRAWIDPLTLSEMYGSKTFFDLNEMII
jgi:hypothetical protein